MTGLFQARLIVSKMLCRYAGGPACITPERTSLKIFIFFVFAVLIFSSCSPARRASRDVKRELSAHFYQYHSQRLGYRLSGKEDPKLIEEVSAWVGTPYRYGGMSRSGTDCSGFVWQVYRQVYGYTLPRSTEDMARATSRVGKNRLKEGDLVFFRINKGRKVAHVGIYLGNNRFVHVSTSRGLIISELSEPYYASRFAHGGRLAGLKR